MYIKSEMKTSKRQLNPQIEKQVYQIFYQVLADCKNPKEVEEVLTSLMSQVEILAIAKRLAIGVFLDKGHSYEHIRKTLKVSSATIASVAEEMNKGSLDKALQKIKAEEWAEEWSEKIGKILGKWL